MCAGEVQDETVSFAEQGLGRRWYIYSCASTGLVSDPSSLQASAMLAKHTQQLEGAPPDDQHIAEGVVHGVPL